MSEAVDELNKCVISIEKPKGDIYSVTIKNKKADLCRVDGQWMLDVNVINPDVSLKVLGEVIIKYDLDPIQEFFQKYGEKLARKAKSLKESGSYLAATDILGKSISQNLKKEGSESYAKQYKDHSIALSYQISGDERLLHITIQGKSYKIIYDRMTEILKNLGT